MDGWRAKGRQVTTGLGVAAAAAAVAVAASAAEATGWVSYQVSTLTLCTRLPLQDSAAAVDSVVVV